MKFGFYEHGYIPPSTSVIVVMDKEGRDQAKASKKRKRSRRPKSAQLSDSPVRGKSKTQNSPSNVQANKGINSPEEIDKIQNSPHKNKNQAHRTKSSAKYNNLAHKRSTGATNWQKFLDEAEKADGVKKKPTVKSPPAEHRLNKSVSKKKSSQNQTGPSMTKVVGLDCEMVGVGEDGRDSILARVSIVNGFGDCLYDKYVKPREKVTDYRTYVSGIREEDLTNGEDFEVVQREVANILRHRILVGHAIKNDLEVLFLSHPRQFIRDTAKFFRKGGGKTPSLKSLAAQYLDVTIQEGEHSSVQDAKAAVQLYNLYRKQWEHGGGNKKHNRIDTYHNKIRV